MHQALYRKWRPQTFEDVYGQDHITKVLKYEAEHGLFSHAYLFCGSRGTGKTTCAKILARVVNCEHPVNGSPCGECEACKLIETSTVTDILEMDAASNNSVDNIRDIRDEVVYLPSSLRYRVYIIDEVHMLSGSAFNALLKTLEEPPAHVIFILATTELHKLPSTIISRCQRFDFRRIAIHDLMKRLLQIAEAENIEIDNDAAFLIAKMAQGGMRDSISLLELCAGSHERITVDLVNEAVGSTGRSAMIGVVRAIVGRDYETILSEINRVVQSSQDIRVFWQDLISLYRDLLVFRTSQNASAYLDLTESEADELKALATLFTKETLLQHSKLLEDALFSMQKSADIRRITAEFTLLRLCEPALSTSPESMLSRISELERTVDMLKRNSVPSPISSEATISEELPLEVSSEQTQSHVEKAQKCENAYAPQAASSENSGSAFTAPPAATASGISISPGSSKRVLKTLRGWPEVVEHLAAIHPMYRAMLGDVKAYSMEDGSVILRFPNPFKLMNFEQLGSRDQMRGELSYLLRRDVKDRELILEVASSEAHGRGDLFDEIIEASDGEI